MVKSALLGIPGEEPGGGAQGVVGVLGRSTEDHMQVEGKGAVVQCESTGRQRESRCKFVQVAEGQGKKSAGWHEYRELNKGRSGSVQVPRG